MKPHYEKYTDSDAWNDNWVGRYSVKYHYFRPIQTQNERRQNAGAIADGYKVRGRRRNLRHSWDDPKIGRTWGRSWKDYTKQRKQYNGF